MEQIYKILLNYNTPVADFHSRPIFNLRYTCCRFPDTDVLSPKGSWLMLRIMKMVVKRKTDTLDEAIYKSIVVDLNWEKHYYNRSKFRPILKELVALKFIFRVYPNKTLFIVNPYMYNKLTKEQALHLIARLESMYESTVRVPFPLQSQ